MMKIKRLLRKDRLKPVTQEGALLLFDGDISRFYSYYLRARILARYFAWDQGYEGSEDQD